MFNRANVVDRVVRGKPFNIDEVIRHVAPTLIQHVDNVDFAFRENYEAFVVPLMPGMPGTF